MKLTVGGRAAAVALLLASGTAMAETRFGADVGVNGGYSTNPYGSSIANTGSATLNGTFSPSLTVTSPTGAINIGGSVTHTEYAKRYQGTTDISASISTQQQLSVLTTLTAGVGYISQVRNGLYPVFDPGLIPGQDPNAPVIVDPSATTSFAERTQSFTGNVGLSFTLSPRDSISVSGRGTHVNVPALSPQSRDYDTYGAGLSYMRAIGANTSIGLQFDASRVDYAGGGAGSGTQYSPSAVFNTKLAPRVTLRATAGLTFSNTELLVGSINETSFAGSVGICHEGERARFCLDGSRRVAPSTFSGTSKVTTLSASYDYKLSQRSSLRGYVGYSRANALTGIGNTTNDYGQAGVSYSHQILERLSAVVSVSYSDSYDNFVPRDANFYGSIGVRYRLGDL